MYRPEHFIIQELVPPDIFRQRGKKAWELLDPRMLATIDQLRGRFGPMYINTWHSPTLIKAYGIRQHSGLRTLDFYIERYGKRRGKVQYRKSFSQHKYGRAFDALFRDFRAEEIRAYVRANRHEFPYLTAIEDNVSWFHGDVRNTTALKVFNP